MRRTILVVLFVLFLHVVCHAQPQTGTYPHGAFDAKTFDTINIGNLNAYFSVPVLSKPGRGLSFYYNLAYNSSIWAPLSASGTHAWTPVLNWGWTADTDAQTGYASDAIVLANSCTYEGHKVMYEVWGDFVYHDIYGTAHPFLGVEVSNNPTCSGVPSSNAGTATDSSGYQLAVNSPGSGVAIKVTSAAGKVYTAPYLSMSGVGSTVDSNGNTISINSSNQIVDTTGNAILTVSGTAPSPKTYTYTDTSNTSRSVTVNYSSYSVETAFGCSGVSEFGPTSEYLISSIGYPDGTSYSFTYEPTPGVSGKVTGRLASVTLPEGGVIEYNYSGGNNGIECTDGGTATLTRVMPNDPVTPTTTYTRTPGTNSTHTVVVDGLTNTAEYDFVNASTDPNYTPYLINHIQYEGSASGTPLISEQSCLNGATPPCTGQSLTLPITSITTTSTLNGTAVKQSALTFNGYGLLTSDYEYDYGSGSPGAELSQTTISYAGLTNGIVNRPSTVTTLIPSGSSSVAVSTVSYAYDGNSLTTKTGLPKLAAVTGSRGNLTSVQYTTGASSPATITTAQYYYDNAGQVVTSEDENLNQTTYSYDSGTDTFQTGVTYPMTGGVGHSTSATYDAIRGVMLTSHDLNSNPSTYTYDLMLRPYTISTPGGGYQTFAYSYGPSSPYTSVSTLHTTGGANITATSYLDPYGRLIKTDTTDTPSDDLVAFAYDADGNLNSVSNPYRSGGAIAYTTSVFDALGRPTTITDSDGSSQNKTSYSGNTVTATDEAGKQRELVSDGLGRISKVFEPDSSGSLTLETDYLYLQNATTGSGSNFTTYQSIINQKGGSSSSSNWRTRTFTYDMLGRTSSKTTPEAGTISYTYPNGSGSCAGIATLACGRTDANSTTTSYSYDALNRLTGKSYGGSTIGTNTPSVTYYYDQTSYNGLTIVNGNGARTGMSDGSGNTAWSFDDMGRTAAVRKTINSVTDQANYTYNADGTTNTVQDFGGTTFTYSYDVSGRPTSIVDGSSNTYASSAIYDAAGQLTSLNHHRTSSGGAYVRSIQFNNRLQPSVISATLNGNAIQSLTYGYGAGGTNNGNILTITNGMNSTRSQTYTYDNLNRVASGRDVSNWGENYTYDNWGNLYQTQQMSGLGGNNWSVTANGNNQLSNLTYDSAGEVTKDQLGNSFTYDANGRILTGGSGTYVYDGDGNRVKKTVSGTTTLYWPGAGSLLDESNSSGTTFGKQVQFAGLLVWHEDTSGTGNFLFHDQLGSTRITGSASGSLADDNDYESFGGIFHNYGASPSDINYLFTGDESDAETSSYYATYRNLGNMGRFNRPDPYDGSYDPTNPQSLNRYSYALNNPLAFIDPSGLDVCAELANGVSVAENGGCDGGGIGGGSEGDGGQVVPACPSGNCLPPIPSPPGQTNPVDPFGVAPQNAWDPSSLPNGCPYGCPYVFNPLFSSGNTAPNNPGHGPAGAPNTIINPHKIPNILPFNINFIIPVFEGIIGPAITITYLPLTKNVCIAGGLGATAARTVSGGPLTFGNIYNAKSITEGPSISVGVQSTPFRGVQATGNFNGVLGGPTVGVPGASITATSAVCF
jgi:RHS repeat-associated protein